ncbi:hypothetical protein ACLOJK_006590 [Asimina triloba]
MSNTWSPALMHHLHEIQIGRKATLRSRLLREMVGQVFYLSCNLLEMGIPDGASGATTNVKEYGSCIAGKIPEIERDMCLKEFLALKSCMQSTHPTLRCSVPGGRGLHYDDGNKLLLSPASTEFLNNCCDISKSLNNLQGVLQVFSWRTGQSASSDFAPTCDQISEGPVLSIRYSLDGKVIGIQRAYWGFSGQTVPPVMLYL